MKKFLNAFTLLELSIVLVIIVILTTISFDMGEYFFEQNRVKTTEIKLKKIQDTLNAYLVKKGKLPCPAGLKNSDGKALSNCSTTNETNGVYFKNGVARGGVPFKDLELTSDVTYDSWGNKITYSVAEKATEDFYRMPKEFNGIIVYNDYIEEINKDRTKITDEAVYAINSHGKNGLGAFNKGGTQNKRTGIKDAENINVPLALSSHENNKFVYFTNPVKKAESTGDDFGKYATRMQMAIDNELENLNAYIDSDTIGELISNNIKVLGSDIELTKNSFAVSGNYLPYGSYIDSNDGQYRIINSKYGILNLVKINDTDIIDIKNDYVLCDYTESPIEHATLSSNNVIQDKYRKDDTLNMSCVEGYKAAGTDLYIKCEEDGYWSSKGSCIPKTCENSTLYYANATFVKTGTTNYNDTQEVVCNTGYEGTIIATCSNSQTWNYSGNCTIKTCQNSSLRTDLNVTFTTTGTTDYGDHQVKNCNNGYTGSVTATCKADKTWSYEGTCAENSCTPFDISNGYLTYENGTTINDSVLPGTTVIKKCNNGYYLDGTASYTCSEGEWILKNSTGTCSTSCECIQVCDKATLRSGSTDNIISTTPGVPGSKFWHSYSNTDTSGTTYGNGQYFADGAIVDAYCDGYNNNPPKYYEIAVGGQIDSTWGTHAYKCVDGEWKRTGTCFKGCKNDPSDPDSSTHLTISNNSDNTQPTYTIDGIKYYANNAVIKTKCADGYSEVCPTNDCNAPNGKEWWTWLQCENAKWVQKGSCVRDCPYDGGKTNGYWADSNGNTLPGGESGGTVPYGTIIQAKCDNGYVLSGSSIAECRRGEAGADANGWKWTSDTASCAKEIEVTYIAINGTSGSISKTFTEGESVTCGVNAFGSDPARNVFKMCKINGTIVAYEGDSFTVSLTPTKASTCIPYFLISSNSNLSNISDISQLSNTNYSNYSASTGGQTVYKNNAAFKGTNGNGNAISCNSGYSGNPSSPTITCNNGTWSYSGSCVQNCPYDGGKANGYWADSNGDALPGGESGGTVPYGTRIQAKCDNGYVLSGSSIAECRRGEAGTDASGWKWTSNTASCVKKEVKVRYVAVTGVGTILEKNFTEGSNIKCNIDTFGSDPAYGTFKMCKIGSIIVGYEGDTFEVLSSPTATKKCIPYFVKQDIGSNGVNIRCENESDTACSVYSPTGAQTVYENGNVLSNVGCRYGYSGTNPVIKCENGKWKVNSFGSCKRVCTSVSICFTICDDKATNCTYSYNPNGYCYIDGSTHYMTKCVPSTASTLASGQTVQYNESFKIKLFDSLGIDNSCSDDTGTFSYTATCNEGTVSYSNINFKVN